MPAWVVERVKNFRFRGSSGKVNIALDGLPKFHGIPDGSPCLAGDIHTVARLGGLAILPRGLQEVAALQRQFGLQQVRRGLAARGLVIGEGNRAK